MTDRLIEMIQFTVFTYANAAIFSSSSCEALPHALMIPIVKIMSMIAISFFIIVLFPQYLHEIFHHIGYFDLLRADLLT